MQFKYQMKKIKFIVFLIFIHLFGASTIYCQNKEDKPIDNKKVDRPYFTGGNFGLQFGSVTAIDFSPILGYRITENIAVGIGATYQYYKDARSKPDITTDIYGGRLFARYYFWEKFFLHTEYELINFEKLSIIPGTNNLFNERIWENNLFVGGGYRQLIGDFSSMHLSILWNFNQGPYSPFSNPQLRIGFDILL